MDGIVNVRKPAGMTSHDVVGKLRGIFHTKRVGHTGTLDPDAIGVLPICVGQATRLAEYLTEKEKVYKTILRFGTETTTQDASGEVVRETELPTLSKEAFCSLLEDRFIGEIQQLPPMYSAIKKNGQPLYKLAREGQEVEREPRTIQIKEIKVIMYNKESAMLEVHCGKGTYIRTLCEDIGKACGSSAHMIYLARLQSGMFTMEKSVSLEQLAETDHPEQFLVDMNTALGDMPALKAANETMQMRLMNGLSQKVPGYEMYEEGTVCRALAMDGRLIAIGTIEKDTFQPHKVFTE